MISMLENEEKSESNNILQQSININYRQSTILLVFIILAILLTV